MHLVSSQLDGVRVSEPCHFRNLTVFPLIDQDPRPAEYLTLDEALGSGAVRVGELSADGSVPQLKLTNVSPDHVLLLDGEELVGAKQNRVLNLTILVGPQTELVIPVSCVEQGRWTWHSEGFESRQRTMYARGRAAKMAQVSESIRFRQSRCSSQAAVWDDISGKMARLDTQSDTGSMSDVYEQRQQLLAEYGAAFDTHAAQAGAVYCIDGKAAGLELFDSPDTFRKLAGRLLASYALDALETGKDSRPASAAETRGFLREIAAANATVHHAIGEGQDIRLDASQLVGGALHAGGRIVHLSAFRAMGHRPGAARPLSSLRRRRSSRTRH